MINLRNTISEILQALEQKINPTQEKKNFVIQEIQEELDYYERSKFKFGTTYPIDFYEDRLIKLTLEYNKYKRSITGSDIINESIPEEKYKELSEEVRNTLFSFEANIKFRELIKLITEKKKQEEQEKLFNQYPPTFIPNTMYNTIPGYFTNKIGNNVEKLKKQEPTNYLKINGTAHKITQDVKGLYIYYLQLAKYLPWFDSHVPGEPSKQTALNETVAELNFGGYKDTLSTTNLYISYSKIQNQKDYRFEYRFGKHFQTVIELLKTDKNADIIKYTDAIIFAQKDYEKWKDKHPQSLKKDDEN